MSLIVQPPVTVTNAMLTSTSLSVEDPGTPWASGGAVNVGDERWVGGTVHQVFKRKTAGPANATSPELDTANWQAMRPTNQWAMFDALRSTQTVSTTTLVTQLTPGRRIDSLGLIGLQAAQAKVTVLLGAVEVYSRTVKLVQRATRSWYQYYTGKFEPTPSLVLWDLPPFAGAVIRVELTPLSGEARCGRMSIGMQVYVGEVQLGAENDADNFSEIKREFDGSLIPNVTLIPRRSVPTASVRVHLQPGNVDRVRKLRTDLNAVPALWCGAARHPDSDYYESLLIFGIYRRMRIGLDHKNVAFCNAELEEI